MAKYLVTRKNASDFLAFLAELGDYAFNNDSSKRSEVTNHGLTLKWGRQTIKEHGKWEVKLDVGYLVSHVIQDILDGKENPTKHAEVSASVFKGLYVDPKAGITADDIIHAAFYTWG